MLILVAVTAAIKKNNRRAVIISSVKALNNAKMVCALTRSAVVIPMAFVVLTSAMSVLSLIMLMELITLTRPIDS
jgi:mRNA-degrading endonuclease toxin of MazEF toxin-antitoxin module